LDHEVILVDNGSSDQSIAYVREQHPSVRTIALQENVGFAKGVNVGIKASDSEFVALINNDIELESHWLANLVEALRTVREVGAVTGKMLNYYQRDVIDAAGDELSLNGNAGCRGHGEKDGEFYDEQCLVFGVCAGAALYRRSMFNDVGLFDEDFFAWYEDADLDLRMQLRGYKCMYVPTAVCYHKRGGTVKTSSPFFVRHYTRNNLLYVTKNFPLAIILIKAPRIIVSRIWRWSDHVREGNGRAVLDALVQFTRMLPATMKKRRKILAGRKVSLPYIGSLFTLPAYRLNQTTSKTHK
jgi:GT2 family glycosyltransferase